MATKGETKLDGVVLVEPQVHGDERGFFVETYARDAWKELGVDADFVQHNHSRSSHGTLRGLHFQTSPGQAKLLRCARGAILDVAVDIRHGSPTFGQSVAIELNADKLNQLLVPIGFAHGFCTLEPDTMVLYKVSAPYSPAHDRGILWNDPDLGIEWPLDGEPILSAKDAAAPTFKQAREAGILPSW